MTVFALALVLSGCTPAGPHALIKGKKYLDRGDYADAVSELKTASTLLATNASVWNYYGVALQGAGQPEDAANAYKRALELDRDLLEAHYNLGCLWLEHNKPDLARTEFTAYTLRRSNDPAGWLKLGMAQLRLGEVGPAEGSFSAARFQNTNEPAAYNGLGLAYLQGGSPSGAAKFFAFAVHLRPDYAPAILNLATVNQQYLHDNKAALDNYRNYLALNPRPANWDEVNALADSLAKSETKPDDRNIVSVPVEKTNQPLAESRPQVRTTTQVVSRPLANPPEVAVRPNTHSSQNSHPVEHQDYSPAISAPVQTVQVPPDQPIVTAPRNNTVPMTTAPANNTSASDVDVEEPAPPPKKTGFWHSLFGGSKHPDASSKYMGDGLTPIAPGVDPSAAPVTKSADMPAPKPVEIKPVFPRYNYYSPVKTAPGDHTLGSPAAVEFTRARTAETEQRWSDALEAYQQAATLDPSWFEAQYNTGVMAHRLRNFALALPRYESALAIQPDSVDARYNFALALRAGGYPMDAANELKKILAASPNEVRAHLALANISAQTLRDTDQARLHYQKVLELDPRSPQASDIRFWLSANSK